MSVKILGAFLSMAFIILVNSAEIEQDACPLIYSPVCATDGNIYKSYPSSCVMNAENSRLKRQQLQVFSAVDDAWCETTFVENLFEKLGNRVKPECLKACPSIYAPVCIANDEYRSTISSACEIDIYNCMAENNSRRQFTVLKNDKC